jgi:hypothetical protein
MVMDKVRLSLDELQIQSFSTTDGDAGKRGTIRAHDAPTDEVECATAEPAWNTCWNTCQDSCYGTCASCDCPSGECSAETCFWGCHTVVGLISIC